MRGMPPSRNEPSAERSIDAAIALRRAGRIVEAKSLLAALAGEHPEHPRLLQQLALLLHLTGRGADAVEHAREAARLAPREPILHITVASICRDLGRYSEAADALRQALALQPTHPATLNDFGAALRKLGRYAEAEVAYRHALQLQPEYKPAMGNLAGLLEESGRAAEANEVMRQVLRRCPDPALHGQLLLGLHNVNGNEPKELFAEHLEWARLHAGSLAIDSGPYPNDRDPGRVLRVGYVSPDFRAHPVARFFEPLLANHDPSQVHTILYSDVETADELTARLQTYASQWRDTRSLADEALTNLIRRDGIDVLVDLTGHTRSNRLLAFARRPAPVQVTCIGYVNTTGLSAIQYRLTDPYHDPPQLQADRFYTEQLVRLPRCLWCYRPDEASPTVSPSPVILNGYVTFGALNRLAKTTPDMARLWARVLDLVPGARLIALAPENGQQDAVVRASLERYGIPRDRLTWVGRLPREQYLRLFDRVDIMLDTFPYNGQTTTLDAAWMGVPTVSLAGETHVSRAGASVLPQLGLNDLVTESTEAYVRRVVRLASDVAALQVIRSDLRRRFEMSALRDERGFAQSVEGAYRRMWQDWCAKEAHPYCSNYDPA
jgi:protein O-GlcNAc transferase